MTLESKILLLSSALIREAMQQLNATAEKTLFVVDVQDRLLGALTDGDIRRWILAGGSLDERVEAICNKHPKYVTEKDSIDKVRSLMLEHKIECVPVLRPNRTIARVHVWKDVFDSHPTERVKRMLNLPVVVMAGGKGTRLDPFTRILPKPLIPIGDRSIIEIIFGKFHEYGIGRFYVSVNHKSKIIRSYLEEIEPPYRIEYLFEDKPLGTVGALKALEGKVTGDILLTNCDIIINADYADLLDHHQRNVNDITIVASLKHFHIPYGVCEIENGGDLTRINEKPIFNYLVNTGMYIVDASMLPLIPKDTVFHMTDLIEKAKSTGLKVGVFPIGEEAWIDTGEWEEYRKAVERLGI